MTDTEKIHQFAVQNLLPEKYLLGELSGADLEDFEQHMFECATCFEAVKAGQVFTQTISAGVSAPRERRSMQWWWQRVKDFFTGRTTLMISMFFQLGPLPSPPPPEIERLEFEFWAQACLWLLGLVILAVVVFFLLFNYSERFRERCALYVEEHGTPLGGESKGGA
jgi:hypothetical protein